jgi:hypothetical protein
MRPRRWRKPLRVLARRESQVAGEVTCRGETPQITHKADQCRGDDEPDAGDLHQALDRRQLAGERGELALDQVQAPFDLANLLAGLGEQGAQRHRQLGVGVLEQRPDRRPHLACPDTDEHALLAQQPAQGVQARRALTHPALAQPVQRGQHLLLGSLDRHRPDLAVAVGFYQRLGTSMPIKSQEESISSMQLTAPAQAMERRS